MQPGTNIKHENIQNTDIGKPATSIPVLLRSRGTNVIMTSGRMPDTRTDFAFLHISSLRFSDYLSGHVFIDMAGALYILAHQGLDAEISQKGCTSG